MTPMWLLILYITSPVLGAGCCLERLRAVGTMLGTLGPGLAWGLANIFWTPTVYWVPEGLSETEK